MALTLTNLLSEIKLALRNPNETDKSCYTMLNSVKDEFQAKAVSLLGGAALSSAPSSLTITLAGATYSYSLSSASPTIGHIIEAKTNNGLSGYVPMRRSEGAFYDGMVDDIYNPEYRVSGGSLEIKFNPLSGYVIVYYAPQIYTVSSAYTGTSTTQSYQIDEVDRAWAWFAAARNFESNYEDKEAGRCYSISDRKLFAIPKGTVL